LSELQCSFVVCYSVITGNLTTPENRQLDSLYWWQPNNALMVLGFSVAFKPANQTYLSKSTLGQKNPFASNQRMAISGPWLVPNAQWTLEHVPSDPKTG
jgi:hypothetical protein